MKRFMTLAALGLLVPVVSHAGIGFLTEIKVEMIKPQKEKLVTLRFLKENRDFLRSQMDFLKQVPVVREEPAVEMNERFLTYQEMLASLSAARDTMAGIDKVEEQEFLTSVTQLGDLESELDLLAGLLEEQEVRLWSLQNDFLGRQQTALVVVTRGAPKHLPTGVIMTDGFGESIQVELDSKQLTGLNQGGVVQVFHGLVEPRSQTWKVAFTGDSWDGSAPVYLSFAPTRNRLTFMELELDALEPETGAQNLVARSWVHAPDSPAGD